MVPSQYFLSNLRVDRERFQITVVTFALIYRQSNTHELMRMYVHSTVYEIKANVIVYEIKASDFKRHLECAVSIWNPT